ncbi:VOC family protein [Echinicola vietnamensis]|uniref:Lactoylglutathione lyase-like lyase n=1 Tax=Echinicola vietnamensis (strain DSM 17526 / LMG 23754 / KMM 6221) TaxID=926556 RepID=L0G1X3_ECHVK|nr:VOC family protein [Echinicola vietnamensis]AGA79507.1 lactoylglutathione lyase-like lyase [Echinicola vietnamensis DSM 17526]
MEFSQIKETCLYIPDLDQAEDFYHKKLKMPVISKEKGRHIFFRCGTSVLLCFVPETTQNEQVLPPHFAHGKQHIAFEVEASAYPESKAALIEQGIIITHEQEWKDGLESCYFEDPFGHVLEIVPKGIWE